MTATLIPTPCVGAEPPPWLANADPRDGIRVRVDGATTLHTGQLAEPSYRVDVLSEDCQLELACGPALLRFTCRPDGDGGEQPERPGRGFGWSVEAPGQGPQWLRTRPCQVLWACAGEREAGAAVAEITDWVTEEAELRGSAGDPAMARAWRVAAERLRRQLETAQALRRVPVRPLRDEFLRQCARGELTAMELARRLGWYWPASSKRPDSARALRRLSVKFEPSERRESAYKRSLSAGEREVYELLEDHGSSLSYELAVKVCRALGCDPADFGCL